MNAARPDDPAGGWTAPRSRNDPCPCGSGLRFKQCHGQVLAVDEGGAARAHLAEGLRLFDAGERLASIGSLHAAWHAARAGPSTLALASQASSCFAYALGEALGRSHRAQGGRLRQRYREGGDAMPGPLSASVVMIVDAGSDAAAWRATLAALARQSLPPVELVVACAGGVETQAIERDCAGLAFPARVIGAPDAGVAQAIDSAIAACDGAWFALVEAGDRWADDYLAAVAGALRPVRRWGCARVDVIDGDGRRAAPGDDAAAGLATDAAASHDNEDTAGSLWHARHPPSIVPGNLFFPRDLWRRLGGFASRGPLWWWSFALDALAEEEPVYAAAAGYAIAPGRWTDASQLVREHEHACMDMLRRHYARMCALHEPANPFAPCPSVSGDAFFRRPLLGGHLLCLDATLVDGVARRLVAWRNAHATRARRPGLTFAGFVHAHIGLGENLRLLARAARDAGVPFDVRDVAIRLSQPQTDATMTAHGVDDFARRLTVFGVNPGTGAQVGEFMALARAGGGRVAGNWFWELERVPPSWHAPASEVDEVWASTAFIADAFRRVTDRPVVHIPTPIAARFDPRWRKRDFGWPEDRFLFLFTFDYRSYAVRKNPIALIEAFRLAFPRAREDVGLYIKSIHGAEDADEARLVEAAAAVDSRIRVEDVLLTRDAMWGLLGVADCYVSLHRSEGLGLGIAESMALGKPVIATAWSGNMDFMREGNSVPVACRLVPLTAGVYPDAGPDDRWADPDLEHAAAAMRRIADDAPYRASLGQEARRTLSEEYSLEATGRAIRTRLEALGAL